MELKTKEFYNLKYGKCFILEQDEKLFLVLVSKNFRKYIVCKNIDEMGALIDQQFFDDYLSAKEYYDKKLSLKM